ncbi:CMP-sialic acid transporter 2 [Diplonema papillatum]|nr:CMP-sialic acid transporter 2 [Diplonema papillatum]
MAILGLETATQKAIFLLYMGLWSGLRLTTYGSQRVGSGAPVYNETSLLVFVCIAKLIIAASMFLREDGGLSDLYQQITSNRALFGRYFLPAMSYVVYDNLTFINLSLTDPVTYVICMQMRLAATGLIWSAAFGKSLNSNQWIAIALLTAACVLQKAGDFTKAHPGYLSLALIGFQILCGVFSSVFNEFLLKEKGSAGVNLQNIFMYVHMLLCNIAWLAICPPGQFCKSSLEEAMTAERLSELFHPWILPIGLMFASVGIVTSLFIKYLDSVRKTIASAIEIFVDALLSSVIFGVPLGVNTFAAVGAAAGGVYLYSKPTEEVDKEQSASLSA